MPTYVYKFIDSGETIEIYQAFSDDALTEAPHPSDGVPRPVKKVFTPVGVTFKGGGFYKTDSAASGKTATSGTSTGKSSETAGAGSTAGTSSTTGAGSDSSTTSGTTSTTSSTGSSDAASPTKTETKPAPATNS